jgi:hypothetical protein
MPVAFFECKILQCCQVFEFIVGNLMILKKNHWIFLIKRIKNYQMFIYGPSKKPEICNYVKNICIIFLWEPNWANFTYGWWSPWWHYEIEIKLACTRCVRCRCIMHRCVISIMFDSCFWFLKKTFLFKQPLVPRCPGPSHFPPPPPPSPWRHYKIEIKQHYCLLIVPNNQIFFKFCTTFNFVLKLELGHVLL